MRKNTNSSTIVLIGSPRTEEARAAGAITPGMLIALGSAGTVAFHTVAGGACERLFAKENALEGEDIDAAYAATDLVNFAVGEPGNVINALLAAGESSDIGSPMTSAGDGCLKVATETDKIVGYSLENIDVSSSAAAAVRIRVRLV